MLKNKLSAHVAEVVEDYINSNDFHDSEITVNYWLLNAVVDSVIHDMRRMQEFHIPQNSSPDRHKYAGYVSKWVARL